MAFQMVGLFRKSLDKYIGVSTVGDAIKVTFRPNKTGGKRTV